MAAQLLLKKIKDADADIDNHVIMDVEIVERQSVISLF